MTVSFRTSCPICDRPGRLLYPATTDNPARLYAPASFRCTAIAMKDHGPIYRCTNCGTGYIYPQPTADELARLYTHGEDSKYLVEERGRRITWERVLRTTIGKGNGRTLLDVGSHTGLFVQLARDWGWIASGIEPNAWARSIAAERYGVALHPSLDNVTNDRFDAITMFDVIEHVTDPVAELQKIRHLLTPNGILLMTTPDLGSPPARLLRSRWYCIKQQHLFYFNAKSIRELLTRAEFRLTSLDLYQRTFSVGYWLDRVATFLGVPWIARRTVGIRRLVTVPTRDELLVTARPV